MEKEEPNQGAVPSLQNNNTIKAEEDPSLRKISPQGLIGGSGDRLKRDEWSEGAVSSLLDAYESKWVLRNRAKLKGHDWEDVARYVSSRANSTKSPKTQTQCKNKIESMKKRYRSESAAADASSWPLFHRLDLLIRCRNTTTTTTTTTNPSPPSTTATASNHPPLALLDHQPPIILQSLPPAPPPPPPSIGIIPQNSHESNGAELASKDEGVGTKGFEDGSDRISMEMDCSTPMCETVKDKMKMKDQIKVERNSNNKRRKKGRRRRDDLELSGSIRWLAEVMLRAEQARMEMIREVEKMRVEAEAKRGEMDLKRTEIIANTQLQIAQILAGSAKSIDSSLRIGRN